VGIVGRANVPRERKIALRVRIGCDALAPGRRARSREGHIEERTEPHVTGEIDCKQEELEVPMGTSRLVPSRGTCRAPIWTRAHAP
jgi:hypothetical protein